MRFEGRQGRGIEVLDIAGLRAMAGSDLSDRINVTAKVMSAPLSVPPRDSFGSADLPLSLRLGSCYVSSNEDC